MSIFTWITVICCPHQDLLIAFLAFYFWLFLISNAFLIQFGLKGFISARTCCDSHNKIHGLNFTVRVYNVWVENWVRAADKEKPSSKTQPFDSLDALLLRKAPTPAQHLELSVLSWSDASKLCSWKQSLCHSFLQNPVWKWYFFHSDKIPYWRHFALKCLKLTIFFTWIECHLTKYINKHWKTDYLPVSYV